MTQFGFFLVLYSDVRILKYDIIWLPSRYYYVIKIKSNLSITDQLTYWVGYACKTMYLKLHNLKFEKYHNNFELRVLILNGVDVVHRIDRRNALRRLLFARLPYIPSQPLFPIHLLARHLNLLWVHIFTYCFQWLLKLNKYPDCYS